MSLQKLDVIDLVAVLPGSPRVSLIVFDYGEVPEPHARETALQRKLETYLRFVLSGEFARTHQQYVDRDLDIKVVCSIEPTDAMKRIGGIGDSTHPETFFRVEVTTDEEFRRSLRANAQRKSG